MNNIEGRQKCPHCNGKTFLKHAKRLKSCKEIIYISFMKTYESIKAFGSTMFFFSINIFSTLYTC